MVKITVDKEKCTATGTCVDVCPVSVYEIKNVGGKKVSVPVRSSECILCRACEVNCPTGAITVEE